MFSLDWGFHFMPEEYGGKKISFLHQFLEQYRKGESYIML